MSSFEPPLQSVAFPCTLIKSDIWRLTLINVSVDNFVDLLPQLVSDLSLLRLQHLRPLKQGTTARQAHHVQNGKFQPAKAAALSINPPDLCNRRQSCRHNTCTLRGTVTGTQLTCGAHDACPSKNWNTSKEWTQHMHLQSISQACCTPNRPPTF
eukprot:1160022-Pelagomonas_calceolata.AAC.1